MKTILGVCCLLLCAAIGAQAQVNIATDAQVGSVLQNAAGVSANAFSRGAGVTVISGSTFSSGHFNTWNLNDAILAGDYIEFGSSTVNAVIALTSLDNRFPIPIDAQQHRRTHVPRVFSEQVDCEGK